MKGVLHLFHTICLVGSQELAVLVPLLVSHIAIGRHKRTWSWVIKEADQVVNKHTFLGLLAKIKCSICSYQFNI